MLKKIFEAEILKETHKAYLITGPLKCGLYWQAWFPKSEVLREEFEDGTFGDTYASEWIIERKEDEIQDYILTE